MASKSLKEVYGFSEKIKKLTPTTLRRLIKEEEEKAPSPNGASPGKFDNPKMSEMNGDGNIADYDAVEIVSQMLSGDPKAPIYKAIAKYHNPEFTPDIPAKADTPEGIKAISAWVKSKKPDFLVQNIKAVQTKLPKSGTAKDSMPALEPRDVGHVVDALAPGGKLNLDLTAPFADDQEDVEVWHQSRQEKKEKKEESIRRMLDILLEDRFPQGHKAGMPGAPPKHEKADVVIDDIKGLALSFLTKGLQSNDKKSPDDIIKVLEDTPIDVAAMIPTQKNVLLGKALAFALGGGFGGESLGAYVTGGNEILDGHHRWAGTAIVDPGAGIKGHKVMAPASDILPVLTALGNALGRQQKGMDHGDAAAADPTESARSSKSYDDLIIERWRKLAGLLRG